MNWNKFLGAAVVVSVVVNLLLAGFIIGRIIPEQRFGRGDSYSRMAPMPLDIPAHLSARGDSHAAAMHRGNLNIGRGARALSEPSREIVFEFMQERASEMRAAIRAVQKKRRDIFQLLSESPENISGIEQAFLELSELTAEAQSKSQQIVLDIAKRLPEDERATFLRAASSSRR